MQLTLHSRIRLGLLKLCNQVFILGRGSIFNLCGTWFSNTMIPYYVFILSLTHPNRTDLQMPFFINSNESPSSINVELGFSNIFYCIVYIISQFNLIFFLKRMQTGALLLDGGTLNYFGKPIPINLIVAVVAEVVLLGGAEYYRITNGLVCIFLSYHCYQNLTTIH